MRVSTDTTPAELPMFLSRFVALIEASTLKRHMKGLRHKSENSSGAEYMRDRRGLELALANVMDYRAATGRVPWPPRTTDEYRLYSFMTMVVRVHGRLSDKGKSSLVGALRRSLDQEHGFSPLAFEMSMAGHLMSAGFDVDFCDLENHERFDFLACKDADVIEIECKFVSDDIGRKIHRKKFHALAEKLKPLLDQSLRTLANGIFVDIRIPDRLHGRDEEFEQIEQALRALLKTGENQRDGLKITSEVFSIAESPFNGEIPHSEILSATKEFVEKRFGQANKSLMVRGQPGQSAIIVSVASEKPDRILEEIYRKHLRTASEQLSGTRIGAAFLYFFGLNEASLRSVAGSRSGLVDAVETILQKRNRMYGVALMTGGEVKITRSNLIIAPTITAETGSVYAFRNPYFSLDASAENIFRKIFGTV